MFFDGRTEDDDTIHINESKTQDMVNGPLVELFHVSLVQKKCVIRTQTNQMEL